MSGDQGPQIKFFWPPINSKSEHSPQSTPSNPSDAPNAPQVSRDEVASTSYSAVIPPSPSPATAPEELTKSKSIGSISSISPRPRTSNVTSEWTMDSIQRECRIYGISLSHLGHVLFPPHRYHHKVFELKIDSILYISYPFCWPKIQRRNKQLDAFNIVFAIDLKRNFGKLTQQNKRMWHDIIIKYVRIVQHEERRIGYLSAQLLRMDEITHSVIAEANKRSKENRSATSSSTNVHNVQSESPLNSLNSTNIEPTPLHVDGDEVKDSTRDIDGNHGVNHRGNHSANHGIEDVVRSALTEICSLCRIANDMKRIQEILSRNEKIKILINDWVELHCSLKPPEQNMLIRPYHTMLLLPQKQRTREEEDREDREDRDDQKMERLNHDKDGNDAVDGDNAHKPMHSPRRGNGHRGDGHPESISNHGMDSVNELRCIRKDAHDVLEQIPVSGSQSLRLMISTANICSSFGDMGAVTNIPLPTLFHFALHLKYWGMAQIIETINKSAEFMIHCNANLLAVNPKSDHHRDFESTFPHRRTLVEELQRFNGPLPLMEMMENDQMEMNGKCEEHDIDQREDFIFLIAWLLQRKLIVRVQKYIKWLPSIPKGIVIMREEEKEQDMEREERRRKLQGLFDKIKPYLNGQNHFMEIMFQTGLSSKKLQQVLETFEDQLIFYSH